MPAAIAIATKNPVQCQISITCASGQPESDAPRYANRPTNPVAAPAASLCEHSAAAMPISICGPKTKKPVVKKQAACIT
ncbi:hypothetical protein SB00610_04305 [Klebsiella quasipneumoniae subsp. similipneumoniae]|nr:hypothetical protein SB00610_04305 [Klebsiella quasipneumoniae subsp. similipneumoniae]